MILVGELSLWIALLLSTWCATVSIAGGTGRRRDLIRSGERAAHAAFVFTALASAGLWTALLSRDFSHAYVAERTTANLPDIYAFAAFWSGPSGSTLFWALLLASCTALTVWSNRATNRAFMPFVTGSLGLILTFLLAATALQANPFGRLEFPALDGSGMNPRLQNPGMVLHPPTIYLGYVAGAIPFAFAVAALATRRTDAGWLATVRAWGLVSWFFLTVGIVLGMWWGYVEAGSGKGWALAPAANASLFPWLTGTALLLATTVRWNLVLIVATFLLSTHAVFITRGRIIAGAHSFSGWPLPAWFVVLLIAATAATAWLARNRLGDGGPRDGFVVPTPKRHGGYIVLAGLVMLFAALAGLAFRREYVVSLTAGRPFEADDAYGRTWRFVSQGISTSQAVNREVTAVALEASLDGRPVGLIKSEARQYFDSQRHPTFAPSTEAGIRGGAGQDIYVVLAGVSEETADLRIAFNPLVMWMWVGGAVLAVGGLIAMWPSALHPTDT